MIEEWRTIEGHTNFMVSNLGRVKSIARDVFNHTGFIHKPERIISQRVTPKGYLVVSLNKVNGVTKQAQVHRLVANAFIQNNDNKKQVNHIDGNKQNNRVDNLEWCTNSENQIHAYKIGLNKRSDKAGKKKDVLLQ